MSYWILFPSLSSLCFMSFDYYRGRWGQKFSKVTAQNFKKNQFKSMTVKTVTVQLGSLKLFTYQSQKMVPFPFPTMNPHFLSLPRWDGRLPGRPCSHTVHRRRCRARGLAALAWPLPPGKPEKADFVTFCPSLPCGVNKWTWDLGLTDRAQLLYSLRKHGHCHLRWETPSGSNLHSVSLVPIHLSQACQHYAFIWPMRSPHS